MSDLPVRAGESSAPVDTVEHVIGIGASAGGLESLQSLLSSLPVGLPVAYIVAQHLAPEHPSLIVELLARVTALTVVSADEGLLLKPGLVVVGPPNRDISVTGQRVTVQAPAPRPGASPSVDLLLTSLAEQWGPRSVGVILSGTGSDGARGLRAIRGAGGLAFVQEPTTARFDGMPQAAIMLAGADAVASAGALGGLLVTAISHIRAEGDDTTATLPPQLRASISSTLRQLTGVDFSGYKESTILRQVSRRMALRHISSAESYELLLAQEPDEAQALASSLLVSVTDFFRDAEVFTSLVRIITAYTADGGTDEPLRVWVPGCATGEEVYSWAMLLSAVLGDPPDLIHRLKIFGTDLDEAALAIARRATYPLSMIDRLPSNYAQRYVTRRGETMQIADRLRQCVVFARHNLVAEPPFPRLDVVSCRNTLIYFTAPLREQALAMFRFALKPGGLLVLGQAESLGEAVPHFSTVDAEHRIYARSARPAPLTSLPTGPGASVGLRPPATITNAQEEPPQGLSHQIRLLDQLLDQLTTPHLVLDSEREVVRIHGDVSAFCQLPAGPMTTDVTNLLRPDVGEEARALLLLCRGGDAVVHGAPILVGSTPVVVSARRLAVDSETYFVLTFEAAAASVSREGRAEQRSPAFDEQLRRLEEELIASRDSLRVSLAELQAANEELEAYSEELQASTEELQASNEELQASNEELRATNDQLAALNHELGIRTTELERLNSDLETIQSSLSQGMIIVDRDLRVTRYSPLAVRLFALIPADIGRSLVDIPTTMPVPSLADALRDVIGGAPRRNLHAQSGALAFLVQVLPHTSVDGNSLGAIVTLTDVSEMEALRTAAESALSELQGRSELLVQQATIDAETGLHTRAFFADALDIHLSLANRGSSGFALMWVDLDHFKEVNDEHGHQAGDLTLKVTGDRLRAAVRDSDTVGRLGGDEFGILVSQFQDPVELEALLDRILTSIRAPISLSDGEARISASIGVALYPQDGMAAEVLLQTADAAMYSVKSRSGDGYAFFDPSMNAEAAARRRMRVELGSSIERGEFELHYQPIVSADGIHLWGIEALVRWHREGQLIPATEFVPFSEESGLIRPLGLLTLRLLRADLLAMNAAGLTLPRVAINVSVAQLEDPSLVRSLAGWPTPKGLSGLVVEVVESVFLPDHHQAMASLREIASHGAQIAIDDFGSGYSNVRLLESLSPDFIKLDRSFLSDSHSPDAQMSLIRSVVEIARFTGSDVIAEGIESDEHWKRARESGADLVQGFGVAPPMPLPGLIDWLTAHPRPPIPSSAPTG